VSYLTGWDPPRPGWACRECAFVFDDVDPTTVADAVGAAGKRFRAPLSRGLKDEDLDAVVRTRPEPDRWSALEYACHIRDVFGLYAGRIGRVIDEDKPEFAAMGRDELAVSERYNEQDPSTVADEVAAAGETLAARLRGVPASAWHWVGTREGEEMSIDWMARNVQHEIDHHLLDVGRTLRHVRGR
jgi:hypothetical protein